MEIKQEEIGDGILKVTLNGSLDIEGAGEADMPFKEISENNTKVIVDFTDVDFLASIGIRVLVKSAKTIGNKGGRLAIYNPKDDAKKVLVSTGANAIVFIADDEIGAIELVK